ncbi:MAG: branched-chain amino acid ABC transporter permease [Deltaproteobacteria bacterium]|nr:branched-chain amino acid ABC transporter permease [Deltaproteobacteria bacterium]
MFDAYTSQILTFIGINSILALSLYLTALAGQLSVGHAAFMGIGAYTSALLMTKLGWPFFLTAPCGALVGGIFGLAIGLPTLRLKDLYLAIATLAFNIIWVVVVMNIEALGGALGIFNVPKVTDNTVVYMSLAVLLLFFYRLQDSRLGRAFRSIQEDEVAARAMGVNAVYFKVYAFTLGALMAAWAGALYAHFVTFISPHDFEVDRSIEILLFVVLGGSQTFIGPVFGAAVLTLAPEMLRFLAEYRLLVYGLMFVVIMLFRHEGIIEEGTLSWKRWSRWLRKEDHEASP